MERKLTDGVRAGKYGNTPPGSNSALKKGCTCPVMDNGHGLGAMVKEDGTRNYWISGDCPIHGFKEV